MDFKMQPFRKLDGVAVALRRDNVDTDQVIPARYLKVSRAEGLGDALFRDLRFDANGKPRPDFPLNDPARKGTSVLIGRKNFGVGSSREAAVYALYDYGIRCVIAPSYGDIFSGNAVQNGLVTAIVTDEEAAEIMETLNRTPELPVTVDLEQQTVIYGNKTTNFTIDPVRRKRLLNGWDDIALTESFRDRIASFRAADKGKRSWAVPAAGA